MTKVLNSIAVDVREWALENDASLDQAINSVLDARSEENFFAASEEVGIRNALSHKLSGFSFLQQFLDDEEVEEIWVNQPDELWYAKAGLHFRTAISFTGEELLTLVERMIRASGRRLDRSNPFIDAQLENGYRLHAVIPDITRKHMSLNIRKFTSRVLTLNDLVARQMLTTSQSEYLVSELKRGANLMVSGATQAGKTTLLTALLSSLEHSERVVSVEDTFELRCLLPDWVALQTRPASLEGKFDVDLRRLVRETLRMRPTRLVVGEVRGAEALDMLIAMNSGIPGLCTIHANSSEEALQKLRTLPLLAGGNISSEFLESVIRTSVKLFVHCKRDSNGTRKVSSIMRTTGQADLGLEAVLV